MARVTQQDIADALGISRATVGLIVGNIDSPLKARLSPDTVRKVQQKAQDMGYQPHRGAQMMRKGRSNLIAVVHYGRGYQNALHMNTVLAQKIVEAGYEYLSIALNWFGGDVEKILDRLIQLRVEGVVISHTIAAFKPEHTARLRDYGIPIVSVNGDKWPGIPLVCDDAQASFELMIKHVTQVKRSHLVMFCQSYNNRPAVGRVNAFRNTTSGYTFHESLGAEEYVEVRRAKPANSAVCIRLPMEEGVPSTYIAYRQAMQVFRAGYPLDAIICSNDQIAFGVINAALELGMKIPEDVSITGYDNENFGEFPLYSLTTMQQQVEPICTESIQILLRNIRGENLDSTTGYVSELVIRGSCGVSVGFDNNKSTTKQKENDECATCK